MKLIVDQGNSACKVAVYDACEAVWSQALPLLDEDILRGLFERYNIEAAIYSSVGSRDESVVEILDRLSPKTYRLCADTPVPLEVAYQRQTLGSDRLASVCGAYRLLGNAASALVIDAGTALTYEILRPQGQYAGGNISPGLWMRFKALRHFTQRLPLIEEIDPQMSWAYGKDTRSAIEQGVVRGFVQEVRAYIDEALQEDPRTQILLTGGDAPLLYERLGMPCVRLVSDLVAVGLLEILEYNLEIE